MSKEDLIKIGKGAVVAMVGSLLTYAATEVVPILNGIGTIQTLVLATTLMIVVNAGRKWLAIW